MNRILIILAVIIVHCTLLIDNCWSQWVQQSVPVSSGIFWDMKFVNANTGFIAHSTNVLLKTTDAGYNWTVNKNGRMTSLSIVDSMCFYGAGYNKDYALWNASIAQDMLKSKRLQFKFQIFDILGQNQSIRRSINGSNITDTKSTILPQYCMFSLTFNFNNFLKPGESMPQNGMRQRGGFGGGGGGGFGGGGFGGGGNRGGGGDSTD